MIECAYSQSEPREFPPTIYMQMCGFPPQVLEDARRIKATLQQLQVARPTWESIADDTNKDEELVVPSWAPSMTPPRGTAFAQHSKGALAGDVASIRGKFQWRATLFRQLAEVTARLLPVVGTERTTKNLARMREVIQAVRDEFAPVLAELGMKGGARAQVGTSAAASFDDPAAPLDVSTDTIVMDAVQEKPAGAVQRGERDEDDVRRSGGIPESVSTPSSTRHDILNLSPTDETAPAHDGKPGAHAFLEPPVLWRKVDKLF